MNSSRTKNTVKITVNGIRTVDCMFLLQWQNLTLLNFVIKPTKAEKQLQRKPSLENPTSDNVTNKVTIEWPGTLKVEVYNNRFHAKGS